MSEAFRTDDMTLATVLAMSGHTYRLESLVGRTGKRINWVFSCSISERQDVDVTVSHNLRGECRVEPKMFVTRTSLIREEMYRKIGTPDRRMQSKREASSQA